LPNKCAKCGYARNKDEDKVCNLCGEVLGGKAGAAPAAPPSAAPPPSPPAAAHAGDTVIPEEAPEDAAQAAAPARPAAREMDPSGMFVAGGLCHLRCSLLEKPLRLRPDKVVTVGRAKESDICVPSQMVSRNHGQFLFEKGVWVYQDLKSANGSRVHGKRVDRVVLQSGDVVDVGGFMITYKEIHDLSDVSEQPEDEGKTMAFDPSMLKRASMSGMDGVAMLGGLGGSLADITIPDILQLCEVQRKSGTLTLDFEGAMGKIFFRHGMMVHAEYGKITGEIAVYKMLNKVKGTFHLDPREPRTDQSIHRPTTTVLMDAARYIDEKGKE
jgi:hypothetical protein